MFKVEYRDGLARTSKLIVRGKEISLPNIAIVVNPNKLVVPPKELEREFGAQIIITNAYIIKKSKFKEEAVSKGLHDLLDFNGVIFTDSGAYQMFSQKVKDVNPKEIVEFQVEIDSDIITPLDSFVLPKDSKDVAEKKVLETINVVRESKSLIPEDRFYVTPVQGGKYSDLRKYCASHVHSYGDLIAIGGLAPLLMKYEFKDVVNTIIECKKSMPLNKPIHCFGAGHPMSFSLLVAAGCDLFDSAMYSLAAEQGRYLTPRGTLNLSELEEFPCSCPVCSSYTPRELLREEKKQRTYLLAKHNLYVTFSELKEIKEKIKKGRLLTMLHYRARAHPKLLGGFIELLREHGEWIEEIDPIYKDTEIFEAGEETRYRPEVIRARKWVKRVKTTDKIEVQVFGTIPQSLLNTYPFNKLTPKPKPLKINVKEIIDYCYGRNASKYFEQLNTIKTKGEIKILVNNVEAGKISLETGLFEPNIYGANLLKKSLPPPKARVIVEKVKPIIKTSEVLFCDSELRIGQLALIVDPQDNLLGIGKLLLSPFEIKTIENHEAVSLVELATIH